MKNYIKIAITVLLCMLYLHAQAEPKTFYVIAGGTPTGTEDGTQGNPFRSIQQAINAASTNDRGSGYHTIYIAAGTYNPGEEESFTLCSTNGIAGDGIVSYYIVPQHSFKFHAQII